MRVVYFSIIMILCLSAACSEPVSETAHMPVIRSFILSRTQVYVREYIEVQATVTDPDKTDKLTFAWSADGGLFANPANSLTQWHAPDSAGDFTITFTVADGFFSVDTSGMVIVLEK